LDFTPTKVFKFAKHWLVVKLHLEIHFQKAQDYYPSSTACCFDFATFSLFQVASFVADSTPFDSTSSTCCTGPLQVLYRINCGFHPLLSPHSFAPRLN